MKHNQFSSNTHFLSLIRPTTVVDSSSSTHSGCHDHRWLQLPQSPPFLSSSHNTSFSLIHSYLSLTQNLQSLFKYLIFKVHQQTSQNPLTIIFQKSHQQKPKFFENDFNRPPLTKTPTNILQTHTFFNHYGVKVVKPNLFELGDHHDGGGDR